MPGAECPGNISKKVNRPSASYRHENIVDPTPKGECPPALENSPQYGSRPGEPTDEACGLGQRRACTHQCMAVNANARVTVTPLDVTVIVTRIHAPITQIQVITDR